MNALNLAQRAYAKPNTPIKTFRSTEYDAFAQITHRMKSAVSRGKGGFSDLTRALFDNNKLWVILATDVADAGNNLPQALRAQLFYLSEFTIQHTPKILQGEASADVLVDINTSVMRGLRQGESKT